MSSSVGVVLEGQLGDQQAHREPDSRDQAEPDHVDPVQRRVELGPVNLAVSQCATEDADQLAERRDRPTPP